MLARGEGKLSLPEVTEQILAEPQIDGGVIKNCLTNEEVALLSKVDSLMKEGALVAALEHIMPQFTTTFKQIQAWWQTEGYAGYSLREGLFYTDFVPAGRGISPHIDYYNDMDTFVQAGLSFSFSVGAIDSSALIKVSRPKDKVFRTTDGHIDIPPLLEWQSQVGSNSVVWSEVEVGYGDLFILPQHSTPAGHSVIASSLREAYILDYLAFNQTAS